LEKYHQLWKPTLKNVDVFDRIQKGAKVDYKTRFTINVGEHIKMLKTDDISCFYSYDKGTFVQTLEDRNYLINYSLEELMLKLNPMHFFRVSRKFIIHINHIQDIISYTNSRLKIILHTHNDEEIIVSREKVKTFRKWLDG